MYQKYSLQKKYIKFISNLFLQIPRNFSALQLLYKILYKSKATATTTIIEYNPS